MGRLLLQEELGEPLVAKAEQEKKVQAEATAIAGEADLAELDTYLPCTFRSGQAPSYVLITA